MVHHHSFNEEIPNFLLLIASKSINHEPLVSTRKKTLPLKRGLTIKKVDTTPKPYGLTTFFHERAILYGVFQISPNDLIIQELTLPRMSSRPQSASAAPTPPQLPPTLSSPVEVDTVAVERLDMLER
jgi:hypothetical protein